MLDLLFVGTGAADYPTALTCECANCRQIRLRGSRNLRHCSSLLVNGKLLVDCGPTVPWRLCELDVHPSAVEAIAITHSHADHLEAEAVASLLVARGERGPLPVFGNGQSLRQLEPLQPAVQLVEVEPGEVVEFDGLRLTAVQGNHITDEEPVLNYIIESGTRRVLYATDTAWPLEATWEALSGRRCDAVIAEATFGFESHDSVPDCLTHHLNWPEFVRLREEMVLRGLIAGNAPFIATHLSLHFVPVHDEFCRLAEPPLMVAHDGLRVVV